MKRLTCLRDLKILIVLWFTFFNVTKSFGLAQNVIIGFDFVNSPQGYISTLAIDDKGLMKRTVAYTGKTKKNSVESIQMSPQALQELTQLIAIVNQEQLGSEYGYGDSEPGHPSYRFRIKKKHAWKEILICTLEGVPKAPDSLWNLQRFLGSYATINIDSQTVGKP